MTDNVGRLSGWVRFFNDDKGYGFIAPVQGGHDVFVHRSDLPTGIEKLLMDQRVSFVIGNSDRNKGTGKKAIQVRIE